MTDLPPLPPPDVLWPDRYHGDERAHSDDAMRAYGEACAAAARADEREACAMIVETHDTGSSYHLRERLADAIRARG